MWRFGVLGPLVVEHLGEPARLPRSRVIRGLLSCLLAAEGEPLPAVRLAELVWGAGQADRLGAGSLHVGMSRLRSWLAGLPAHPCCPDGAGVVVEHLPAGYRMLVDPRRLDLSRFRAERRDARQAADTRERCALLLTAASLCRGLPLSDLEAADRGDPLLAEVDRELRDALLALADAAPAAGRAGDALAVLQNRAAHHALDEPVNARIVSLLAAAGRPAAAVQWYEQVRAALDRELGVGPGRQLQRAYQAVVAQGQGPRPTIRPGLLPAPSTTLVGRDEVMAGIVHGVRDLPGAGDVVPLVAVTGRSGIGKTALAVTAAHRLRTDFPDGQLFVDLHGSLRTSPAEPVDVLARFLRALGVERPPPGLDERAELYRALLADRRALVVLDDAASAAQITPLLPGGPGCAVLVTSRRRLPVPATAHVELGVLAAGAATDLLSALAGAPRLQGDPGAAQELVRLCGGVPLALRIAGGRLGRLQHRPVRWLVERLSDEGRRLDELVLDDLEVRAGLMLSYEALSAGSACLLRRLGLLDAPDVAAWAAARLLDRPLADAEDHLDELVDLCLLDVAGTDTAGQTRYALHDLVRAFIRERVRESGEAPDVVLAALHAWAGAADEAVRRNGPTTFPRVAASPAPVQEISAVAAPVVADPTAWLEAEQAALVAAVQQAHRLGADDLCWRLAASLDAHFESNASYDDWATTHSTALAAARRCGDRLGQARIHYGLGELHADLDRYDQASAEFAAARQALASLAQGPLEAHERRAAGVVARFQGRMHEARDELEAARTIFERVQDRAGAAAAAHGLGAIHREQGRWAEATQAYTHALDLFAGLGDDFSRSLVLCSLGNVHATAGRHDAAQQCLETSLEISRRLKDRRTETYALCYLGELHLDTGRPDSASRLLTEARELGEALDERFSVALVLRAFGRLHRRAGDLPAAHACLSDAADLWRRMDAPIWLARTLEEFGAVLQRQGDRDGARRAWAQALEIFRSLGAPEADRLEHLLGSALPIPNPQLPPTH